MTSTTPLHLNWPGPKRMISPAEKMGFCALRLTWCFKGEAMKILFFVLCLLISWSAAAEIAVIVHPSNNNAITQADLEPLFMVKKSTFADGSKASPYYLTADDAV